MLGVWPLLKKDLRLMLHAGQGLVQAVLLGLLLIFVFSLSRPSGQLVPAQGAAAIFWLASAFSIVLVFNGLYSLEERTRARLALLISPMPEYSVWLGKALAGFALILVCQVVFLPGAIVFLGQDVHSGLGFALAALLLVDWGLVALGSLLGALAQGLNARESLLSVILFPLLLPILLAGIRLFTSVFSGSAPDMGWLGLAAAFDAIFSAAALLLFSHVYSGED